MSILRPAILLVLVLAKVALGADDGQMEPRDDFSLMLFVIAFIAMCVVLFLVGVGIVAAAVAVASAAVLIALGIVSSSAVIGIFRRRFSSGFRALHYQLFAVAALPAGIGACWLITHFGNASLGLGGILGIGSVAGLCGGLLLAFVLDRLAGFGYRKLGSLLERKEKRAPQASQVEPERPLHYPTRRRERANIARAQREKQKVEGSGITEMPPTL